MTDDPETNPERTCVIETFAAGPNAKLNGAAIWMEGMMRDGFELAAAYACPHPTGNMILHHFVMRRRDPVALVLSEETGARIAAMLADGVTTRNAVLEPLEPSTAPRVEPPLLAATKDGRMVDAPRGGQRRR
jgi:hypothetical protein